MLLCTTTNSVQYCDHDKVYRFVKNIVMRISSTFYRVLRAPPLIGRTYQRMKTGELNTYEKWGFVNEI